MSELARSNAKEARCAALVRALTASVCDSERETQKKGEARAGRRWGLDPHLVERIEAEPGGGRGVASGAAVCALSELAALEEAVSERAREVAALEVRVPASSAVHC